MNVGMGEYGPQGQMEWSTWAKNNRCPICNQSFAIMDLM